METRGGVLSADREPSRSMSFMSADSAVDGSSAPPQPAMAMQANALNNAIVDRLRRKFIPNVPVLSIWFGEAMSAAWQCGRGSLGATPEPHRLLPSLCDSSAAAAGP
jgi:hypothetical protein